MGSAKEKERGGSHYFVPELLGIGREWFADLAAAIASQVAADECERAVEAYNSARYDKPTYVFPAPPELKEAMEGGEFYTGVSVSELVAANAPGAEYCADLCGTCWVDLFFAHTLAMYTTPTSTLFRSHLTLEPFIVAAAEKETDPGFPGIHISLSADIVDGDKIGVGATYFTIRPVGSVFTSEDVKEMPEVNAAPLLDLAVWLAKKSREEWGDAAADAAAGLATALLPLAAAAFHEIQRASRVRVAGLGYPAVEEVAEEAGREAPEVYTRVAEAVAAGHSRSLEWAGKIKMRGRVYVLEVVRRAVYSSSMEARAAAERILGRAVAKATAARAAAEILASLSDPE